MPSWPNGWQHRTVPGESDPKQRVAATMTMSQSLMMSRHHELDAANRTMAQKIRLQIGGKGSKRGPDGMLHVGTEDSSLRSFSFNLKQLQQAMWNVEWPTPQPNKCRKTCLPVVRHACFQLSGFQLPAPFFHREDVGQQTSDAPGPPCGGGPLVTVGGTCRFVHAGGAIFR